jgi:hypothetical protein
MRNYFILLLILIILCGCNNSPASIETAIANTQTAMPTNTPQPTSTSTPTPTSTQTPIPLSEIYIDNILLVKGDLPDGFVADPVGKFTDNPIFAEFQGYEQMAIQQFSKENEGIGLVAVYLFKDLNNLNLAYSSAKVKVEEIFGQSVGSTQFGERGLFFYKPILGRITSSAVIFVKCNAFVYIAKTIEDSDLSLLQPYAEKLEVRLTNLLCKR